ncbi:hypothetical protein HK097_005006 [Rhizophlyctis rosea]|uniref:Bacteriophage/plasmid primase P4 C-terminal domain-containing protein n=1 Tax=Rhizophlyctis rosea TaxID=64517 RepID=A0AAD5S0J0_9FUNG|nr:hypothetical protein HK097_005006 [Rhizophlyctis rosea]
MGNPAATATEGVSAPTNAGENNSRPIKRAFLMRIKCDRKTNQRLLSVKEAEGLIRENMADAKNFHLQDYFVKDPEVNPFYDWDEKFGTEQSQEVAEKSLQELRNQIADIHPNIPTDAWVYMQRHGWTQAGKGKPVYKISYIAKAVGWRMKLSYIPLHMKHRAALLEELIDSRIDFTVYKPKEQLLATVYASKDKELDPMQRVRLPVKGYEGRQIRDYLVGFVTGQEKEVDFKPVGNGQKKHKEKKKKFRAAVVAESVEGGLKAAVAKFLHSQWPEKIAEDDVGAAENKGNKIYVRMDSKRCKIRNTPHGSNNAYLFMFPTHNVFLCHDGDCKKQKSDGVQMAYPNIVPFPIPLETDGSLSLPYGFDGSDHMLASTFAKWYKDRFVYSDKEFYRYKEHWYVRDPLALKLKRFLGEVYHKDLVAALDNLQLEPDVADWLMKMIGKTRSKSGKDCIVSELASFVDVGEELNSNPRLLGIANGVVDLTTCTVRPGRPDDRVTIHSDVKYVQQETPEDEELLAYLRQIYPVEDELLAVRLICGYILLGERLQKLCFVFTDSQDGYGGKSTIIKLLGCVLGQYYKKGRCADLVNDRNESAQGHNSNHLNYKGKRLVAYEEFPTDFRLNWSVLKDWTGGNATMGGRHAGLKDEANFLLTAAFILVFNVTSIVDFDKADRAMVQRTFIIPHRAKFHAATEVEAYEKDIADNIPDTYMADADFDKKIQRLAPQFLRWCLQGLKDYHAKQFTEMPRSLTQYKDQIIEKPRDLMERFVEDCLENTKDLRDFVYQAQILPILAKYQTTAGSSYSKTSLQTQYKGYMTKHWGAPQEKADDPKPNDRWKKKSHSKDWVAHGYKLKPPPGKEEPEL